MVLRSQGVRGQHLFISQEAVCWAEELLKVSSRYVGSISRMWAQPWLQEALCSLWQLEGWWAVTMIRGRAFLNSVSSTVDQKNWYLLRSRFYDLPSFLEQITKQPGSIWGSVGL